MTNRQLIEQWCDHLCGSATPSNGKNSNGSLFYEWDTLYSYGYHFPIARFQGGRCVLFNTSKYSHTTSRHQSLAREVLKDYCIDEFVEVTLAEIKKA